MLIRFQSGHRMMCCYYTNTMTFNCFFKAQMIRIVSQFKGSNVLFQNREPLFQYALHISRHPCHKAIKRHNLNLIY